MDKNNVKQMITNKKVALGMLTLLMCVGIIVVSSFFPFIIDPSRWQTAEFLSDELIIIAISITSVISTLFIGQSSNASNPLSELAKARKAFFDSVALITNISAFNQWVKRILQPQDIKSIEKRKIREVGIKDYNIINLERDEIKKLGEGAQKIGERYYSQLTKEQIEVLLFIKDGKLKVKLVEPNYYLTVSSLSSDLTITEKSGQETKKKNLILIMSIFWKIVFTVLTAMIFASFVLDVSGGEGSEKAAAWMRFVSRMFALISSATMGYRVGTETNDIDADYINMRVSVHELFRQDKDFIPLSEEELAKEEFERLNKEYEMARTTSIGTKEVKDNYVGQKEINEQSNILD